MFYYKQEAENVVPLQNTVKVQYHAGKQVVSDFA